MLCGQSSEVLDLVGVSNGGTAIGCSDRHFGHPRNLINPGRYVRLMELIDEFSNRVWGVDGTQVEWIIG